ncbi:hypothetical protein VMT65_08710 [Nocardia sp. CDC153]|uniref:hypothetical protein n=1 Tax=Nocardia sp. CDC153 TaxID=3112167 RepID=UPI002DB8F093|nr:hypothetical protein [Nocardia sp. CDC153]MEC3953108.1 hypothetical protein [Nocardia sp. CDC153]
MTGALHRTGTTGLTSTSPPLPGYLVAATERSISVRVGDGTWTFHRTDVLDITRWDTASAQGSCEGRPVLVHVRPGTTADFTQRRRVEITDRPLTLTADLSPARGDDELRRETEIWARGLELTTAPGVGGATMTCCQTRSYRGSDDGIACDSLD